MLAPTSEASVIEIRLRLDSDRRCGYSETVETMTLGLSRNRDWTRNAWSIKL